MKKNKLRELMKEKEKLEEKQLDKFGEANVVVGETTIIDVPKEEPEEVKPRRRKREE